MNIEVNLNNLTKEEQEQFNALVEKANKPRNKVWKPINGEVYFFISPGNPLSVDCFDYTEDDFDEKNYAIGNCFKTREETEFALERLKVIAEMKRYIAERDETGCDWEDEKSPKYYLDFEHVTGFVFVEYTMSSQTTDRFLYSSSKEILENMIKEIGEDRIKKYYFGVE